MEYDFRLNGKLYNVSEAAQGWSWEQIVGDRVCVDQQDGFSETAVEAQQDAIRHAQEAHQAYIDGTDERNAAFMADLSLTQRIDDRLEESRA